MTRRLPCPAAPGPLEGYAARFDDLFGSLAQRRGFQEYLAGCWRRGTEQDADPAFRTKLQIGADFAVEAADAGFVFRAVAADSAYGDQDGFRGKLADAGLPFMMALKPRRGTWAYGPDAHTPVDAARALAWQGPDDPGDWHLVTRTVRDGTETWYAADAPLGWCGQTAPSGPHEPAASLAEIVRTYGIRHWIEQSYKQVKDQLSVSSRLDRVPLRYGLARVDVERPLGDHPCSPRTPSRSCHDRKRSSSRPATASMSRT
jgi:hypothetical protein